MLAKVLILSAACALHTASAFTIAPVAARSVVRGGLGNERACTLERRRAGARMGAEASQGIFSPIVQASKAILGKDELNKLRAKVIAEHSKVISSFVETSDSKFGRIALSRMFAYADTDGNGELSKEEVAAALKALGFSYLNETQIEGIFNRADIDQNGVVDFEEFINETPKTLCVRPRRARASRGSSPGGGCARPCVVTSSRAGAAGIARASACVMEVGPADSLYSLRTRLAQGQEGSAGRQLRRMLPLEPGLAHPRLTVPSLPRPSALCSRRRTNLIKLAKKNGNDLGFLV